MKTAIKWLGIVIITAVIGLSMTGCATAIRVEDPIVTAMIVPVERDFVILGVVNFERAQRREISYADILAEAISLFPSANAVLDVRIESVSRIVGLTRRNVFVATGIAIQYVTQPTGQ